MFITLNKNNTTKIIDFNSFIETTYYLQTIYFGEVGIRIIEIQISNHLCFLLTHSSSCTRQLTLPVIVNTRQQQICF